MKPEKLELREKLNKLVVATLENQNPLTAKEIYCSIEYESPNLVKRGFKSFVKIMSEFPEVKNITTKGGKPDLYRLK